MMMCNAIMTLYDAAVERRAGSVSYKLESAKKQHLDLEAEKNTRLVTQGI